MVNRIQFSYLIFVQIIFDMAKRALLVGCNYPGTKCELHGCANDVRRMHDLLVQRFGFMEEDILVMLDSDPTKPKPTGVNIRNSLAKLIEGTQPGDVLVFHYSGHGTQVSYPKSPCPVPYPLKFTVNYFYNVHR